MKIEGYSNQDLAIKQSKIDLKFREMKENLKSIRDLAEIRQNDQYLDHSQIGKNIDLYV